MAFELDEIVPLGRSFEEYCRMFCLDAPQLELQILDCGAGPSAFVAGMVRRGVRAVAVDPLYRYSAVQIRERISAAFQQVMDQTAANKHKYVWETIASPVELARVRQAAMEEFLTDYEGGRREGRYLVGALPSLPFADQCFDLALCSHFLFLYSDTLDQDFHLMALRELLRVACEVRVFPLLDYNGQPSPWLHEVVRILVREGIWASENVVDYEFQRGGNRMLRLSRIRK